ncbi:hypothetical protein QE429_002431 [Bacillus sp. SORGH_AS 510]|nr:hypothetical protein [Bacillus sp. SORGH_AS_0510]MDQ1145604.1 hypothetical protein [Bacillus sp. SORGH_AS_0510]
MHNYLYKKDEESGITIPINQESLDSSSQGEKLPEFDVIGTALNDI